MHCRRPLRRWRPFHGEGEATTDPAPLYEEFANTRRLQRTFRPTAMTDRPLNNLRHDWWVGKFKTAMISLQLNFHGKQRKATHCIHVRTGMSPDVDLRMDQCRTAWLTMFRRRPVDRALPSDLRKDSSDPRNKLYSHSPSPRLLRLCFLCHVRGLKVPIDTVSCRSENLIVFLSQCSAFCRTAKCALQKANLSMLLLFNRPNCQTLERYNEIIKTLAGFSE